MIVTKLAGVASALCPKRLRASCRATARSRRHLRDRRDRRFGRGLEVGAGDAAHGRGRRSRRAGRTARRRSAPTRRTTPSISGASRWVRPTSTPSSSVPSTSTSTVSPTSASRDAGRDRILHFGALAQPLAHELVGDRAVHRRRRRVPSSLREREEAGPVEARVGEELEQRVVIGFRLAREADDERRAERRVGLLRRGCPRSSCGSGRRSPIASCAAASPGAACCSERSKYGTTVGSSSIVLTSGSCTSDGIEVEQPDAREAVRRQRVEPAQQRRERTGLADVAAVPREVLRDEHDLGDAAVDQRAHFRLDRLRSCASAASRGTTGSRRTRTRGRSLRRPSRTPTARSARAAAARAGRERRPACAAAAGSTTSAIAPSPAKPDHRVGLGQRGRELVAVALGHAAGDDELGAGPLRVGERERDVDRLLAGRLDERARVHDDEIGLPPGPTTATRPSASRDATTLSESTAFFGQPSVST